MGQPFGHPGASVAGASVAGASVAGASVADASVVDASVVGASFADAFWRVLGVYCGRTGVNMDGWGARPNVGDSVAAFHNNR
jgi:hypothetical protein